MGSPSWWEQGWRRLRSLCQPPTCCQGPEAFKYSDMLRELQGLQSKEALGRRWECVWLAIKH